MLRFVKVALFCTQAGSNQRPTMKQVLEMLSKDVTLNEKALTEPSVYKGQNARSKQLVITSSVGASSSQVQKGKETQDLQGTSTQASFHGITEVIPR